MIGTSLNDPLNMYLSDIFTVAANLTGLPALAMPCGFDDKGLPIGFQLTGRAFAEAELFEAGLAYQSSTDFHLRQPRLNKREEAQK
jgi:aspartyl-tRNA(Asn)/glutamyl-tRNA(Gln) amidotransferase subunit A